MGVPERSVSPPAPRRTHSKELKIGGGLLLTIVGLLLLSVLLPTAPEQFAWVLPVAGLGVVLLWVGGILMGIGSRS
ncbi:MAG: hypothetical protein L3J68_02425 [Thermoplasmata archaeon]|jgi:hypothetical protein|nr:hypothetical protein [Thermoplasmata archaeon]